MNSLANLPWFRPFPPSWSVDNLVTKLQTCCALCGTASGFHSAVTAAAAAKCFPSILQQLGFPPSGPTKICGDKKAAIAMVKESCHAARCHHVNFQWFAIQDWCIHADVNLEHIKALSTLVMLLLNGLRNFL